MSDSASTPTSTSATTSPSNAEVSESPGASKPAQQQEQPRKFKVKVDGQEIEVDEAEVLADYGKGKAADKRFREAAMTKKQAEEFIHMLRTDPIKVLTNPKLGVDFRKLAEEYLVTQLEDEMMDPKDKELRDAKQKLQEIEEEKKRVREAEEAEQAAKLEAHYAEDYSNKIMKSLDASGLPRSQHTIKRMAYYMHEGLKRGYSLDPTDVVDLVKKDYIEEQKSLFGGLDGDMLIQLLGDDVATKIRKHDISKVRSTARSSQQHSAPSQSSSKKDKKISKDEWKERLERLKNGEE